jgi:spore maturation protein CgeB
MSPQRLVFLGLSITSAWGNGHAVTYRSLLRALAGLGHEVTFIECDKPWYAAHRDVTAMPGIRIELYENLAELDARFAPLVREADAVVVGSYVPDGIAVGDWALRTARGITAFYDIDTPVTLASLEAGEVAYLSPALIPRYDLYLSFTGGPTLRRLEQELGSPCARPLYCSADNEIYRPQPGIPQQWDLGYLGTYSPDRQPKVEQLLLAPARAWPDGRFIVAGPQYPDDIDWAANVERRGHVPPDEHPAFYAAQRFTLNITRGDMLAAGWSPSVRLFEAAAVGVPILSDRWGGIETFFTPGREILLVDETEDVLAALHRLEPEQAAALGAAARARVLAMHTPAHRAHELLRWLEEARARRWP